MPNPNPVITEGFIKAQRKRFDGTEPLSPKTVAIRLPVDLDVFVRSRPNSAAWMRKALLEAAKKEGFKSE